MSLSTNTVNVCHRPAPPSPSSSNLCSRLSLSSQVLRYGALGAGIVYGLVHQRSLTKQAKAHAVEAEYKRKEALIAEAKAEWAKRQAPVQSVTASGGGKSTRTPASTVPIASTVAGSCDEVWLT